MQLPPKRRQVIRLSIDKADCRHAVARAAELSELVAERKSRGRKSKSKDVAVLEGACWCGFSLKGQCDCEPLEDDGDKQEKDSGHAGSGKATEPQNIVRSANNDKDGNNEDLLRKGCASLNYQEIGIAKLRGVKDWMMSNIIPSIDKPSHTRDGASEEEEVDGEISGEPHLSPKMVIFAHHLEVLDEIQKFIQGSGLDYVRIDGSTNSIDRLKALHMFRDQVQVRVAIVGVTAGGVGLDFSSAQVVVFAELPKTASDMLQIVTRTVPFPPIN
ncbi:hypothetical protein CBR_g49704 [Chara braunii]|nr:hypothetical protein CBR_g49704 [Chara braunii]|eukprot:GBG89855.1 hypothetical protein CBR_g49704 [Chara braunii]